MLKSREDTINLHEYHLHNCVNLPSATIGINVIVAAESVVTKDVVDNCVVVGVSAKKLKIWKKNNLEEVLLFKYSKAFAVY